MSVKCIVHWETLVHVGDKSPIAPGKDECIFRFIREQQRTTLWIWRFRAHHPLPLDSCRIKTPQIRKGRICKECVIDNLVPMKKVTFYSLWKYSQYLVL